MRIEIVKRKRGSWDRTQSRLYEVGEVHAVPSEHMDNLLAFNFLGDGTAEEIAEAVGPAETKPTGPEEAKPDGPEEIKTSDDEPITSSFVADPEGAATRAAAHDAQTEPEPKPPQTRRRSTRRKKR